MPEVQLKAAYCAAGVFLPNGGATVNLSLSASSALSVSLPFLDIVDSQAAVFGIVFIIIYFNIYF